MITKPAENGGIRSTQLQSVPKYVLPKWLGVTGSTSDVRIFISGKTPVMALAADGVQNRLDRIMRLSRTPCSFNTFTACKETVLGDLMRNSHKTIYRTWITVLPVDIIGYMSSTCLRDISSGNRAYTTRASCVSKSDSIRILPIRIDRQQSRSPCSMASPLRTIETPQLP